MEVTLQTIFSENFNHYIQGKSLPHKYYKAANAIMNCRTPYMGGHEYACEDEHEHRTQYHSCKHRSCPLCNTLPKARWVDAQRGRLLDCDHYHVIFTLPHELLELWRFNSRWFSDALFQACRDTLMTLLQDENHLGALPGIIMALHTWGRNLNPHPHMHCLVTGGGLDQTQQWRHVRYNYLLPVAVVKALFKGKLLARLWDALKRDELTIPPYLQRADIQRLLRKLNEKTWNVHLRERYSHGRGVMLYLARYVKGGAISNKRISGMSGSQVEMRYKDHRDGRNKTMVLNRTHFLERVLWHVPETGQHTVRQYGLYAYQARSKRNTCRIDLGQEPEQDTVASLGWRDFLASVGQKVKGTCSKCGKPLIRWGLINPLGRRNENSIYKYPRARFVQQDDQPDPSTSNFSIRGPT